MPAAHSVDSCCSALDKDCAAPATSAPHSRNTLVSNLKNDIASGRDNNSSAVGAAVGATSAPTAALLVALPYAEIEWTHRRLLYFPWLMFAAGVFSGLLGAPPNTLFLAPYLIMTGCHPQVG
jgi:hypothetical protein